MAIYIKSFALISTQSPLDNGFFTDPRPCPEPYCRAVEANYQNFLSPMAARRMGPILKRAIATSLTALKSAGVEDPDAIIFGTGLGCIDNTEKFLTAMIDNQESCLQPTFFINSTHNTVASQVATFIKCHGYNSTYAHLGISFESALMDGLMQMELGRIGTALIGGHDEMTPTYFKLFDKVDYWNAPLGECAAGFVLGTDPAGENLCRLDDVMLSYSPTDKEIAAGALEFLAKHGLKPSDISCVVTGRNGDSRYDGSYDGFVAEVFGDTVAQCHYKHCFCESFTAPAFGLALGAQILSSGQIPGAYLYSGNVPEKLEHILIVNSFHSTDWSLILLSV